MGTDVRVQRRFGWTVAGKREVISGDLGVGLGQSGFLVLEQVGADSGQVSGLGGRRWAPEVPCKFKNKVRGLKEVSGHVEV